MNIREWAINANVGDYWYLYADTSEEPGDDVVDDMRSRLRTVGLRLSTDDKGVFVDWMK